MKILLSFILVLGGAGLYFLLLSLGVYRPFPIESYAPMAAGIALSITDARRSGRLWRYAVVMLHILFLIMFVRWTASRAQLMLLSPSSAQLERQ